MQIYETQLTDELLEKLIAMSAAWEEENSCHGYRKNDRSDIEPNRIFVAEQDGKLLGYLFGHGENAKKTTSIMPEQTRCFEIEELYVVPMRRSEGIGQALFRFAETEAKSDGAEFVMISTVTKDYKRILHFYIEELGLDFWSARLFKKL